MQAVTERRLELFVLLKNAVRVASEDAYSFASMRLQHMLNCSETTFQVSLLSARARNIMADLLQTPSMDHGRVSAY